MASKIPPAPAGLQKNGKKFWRAIHGDFVLQDAHHLALLEQAARALDRCTEAQEALKRDGSYLADRFGALKAHPALKVEKDNRTLFIRAVRELGLDLATVEQKTKRTASRY